MKYQVHETYPFLNCVISILFSKNIWLVLSGSAITIFCLGYSTLYLRKQKECRHMLLYFMFLFLNSIFSIMIKIHDTCNLYKIQQQKIVFSYCRTGKVGIGLFFLFFDWFLPTARTTHSTCMHVHRTS